MHMHTLLSLSTLSTVQAHWRKAQKKHWRKAKYAVEKSTLHTLLSLSTTYIRLHTSHISAQCYEFNVQCPLLTLLLNTDLCNPIAIHTGEKHHVHTPLTVHYSPKCIFSSEIFIIFFILFIVFLLFFIDFHSFYCFSSHHHSKPSYMTQLYNV